MKRTWFFILSLLLIAEVAGAQKVSNIDFSYIKAKVTDSLSDNYYPKLIARFVAGDKYLSAEQYNFIYYGNAYTSYYSPYEESEKQKQFLQLYRSENYKEAIPLGEDVLKENPVNLLVSFKLGMCYHVLGDRDNARLYGQRYFNLLNTIYESGDGQSLETAYVVMSVQDEYEVLKDKGLSRTAQALEGETDVITINTKNQQVANGQKKVKKMYFNVSQPLQFIYRKFREEKGNK